jgi:ABC-2 type transport system permease protein
MKAQLRAELLKQHSTRANLGLFVAMLGLVLFAVLLHGLGVAGEDVGRTASEQLERIFDPGQKLGALFAGLLGALAFTNEIRHGTIRPTFLVTPSRSRVIAAKVGAGMMIGAGFGLAAGAMTAGVATAALRARGIDVLLDAGDYGLLLAGGAAAGALWAAIGVGVGALLHNQIPTAVGLCAWLLFVEGLLLGDLVDLGNLRGFAPGGAAAALSGIDRPGFFAPTISLILLATYAAAIAIAGAVATTHRDIA